MQGELILREDPVLVLHKGEKERKAKFLQAQFDTLKPDIQVVQTRILS